jgi:DNA-binding MarR family transcriptional regulator
MAEDDVARRRTRHRERPAHTFGPLSDSSLDENAIRLLLVSFRITERRLLTRAAVHGYSDIRMTHFPIMRSMSRGAERMTDIAERANITKQTAGALVHELETMGYIGRYPDPRDGRAKVVRFTRRGRTLMRALPHILDDTIGDLVDLIGTSDLDELMRILGKLVKTSGDPLG